MALTAGLILLALAVLIGVRYRDELRSWYEFHRNFAGLPVNAQGYPEYRHRQSGIVMVRVPGGMFRMGSPETEIHRQENEGPVHPVCVSPFLIAKYEVTQKQWEKVMGTRPSEFSGRDLPVENVSWADCMDFCERTGLALPTEAQWEYACRAGTTTPFSFDGGITPDRANYDGNHPHAGAPKGEYRRRTVPVDSFEPNDWGLYNMHGNVWEWCQDAWDESFYSRSEATRKDPVCSASGSELFPSYSKPETTMESMAHATPDSEIRVLRGGSWFDTAPCCRSAFRFFSNPSDRHPGLGFRPVRSP